MRNNLRKYKIIFSIAINLVFLTESMAQIADSSFYGWKVFEYQEDELSPKQCYIFARPFKSDSDHLSRKKPYLMITRYQRQRNEEVSIYGGFEYKLNSKVFMAIDDKTFQFLAGSDVAWSERKYEDFNIVSSMLNGAVVRVRSNSSIGTYAVDEYSLQGITRAYARMKEICK